MFTSILVPVDLAHISQIEKSLGVAAAIANSHGASVCYIGVTAAAPSEVAHTPTEFAQKLDAFGQEQATKHGHGVSTKAVTSHDPATDLGDILLNAVDDLGADLVVMASHMPTLGDYVWPSNGGKVASHAKASVFLVR
ncbi:MAG: universal stress protein [Pseudomonadota bacterium]